MIWKCPHSRKPPFNWNMTRKKKSCTWYIRCHCNVFTTGANDSLVSWMIQIVHFREVVCSGRKCQIDFINKKPGSKTLRRFTNNCYNMLFPWPDKPNCWNETIKQTAHSETHVSAAHPGAEIIWVSRLPKRQSLFHGQTLESGVFEGHTLG